MKRKESRERKSCSPKNRKKHIFHIRGPIKKKKKKKWNSGRGTFRIGLLQRTVSIINWAGSSASVYSSRLENRTADAVNM